MRDHTTVLVAGAGIAAAEALLALHELAGPRVRLELLAPGTELLLRPAAVAAPFGLGGPPPVPLAEIAAYCRARHHTGVLTEVRAADHTALTAEGERLAYDHLVVAVGARSADALPGAVAFGGPADVPALTAILDRAATGQIRSIAFAAPSATSWTLPVYELALMASTDLRARGADTRITVVSAESEPLWLFGDEASGAVSELLDRHDIAFLGARATAFADARLELVGGRSVAVDAAVVVPPVQGPWLRGIPHDGRGFVPVDPAGRVEDCADVWAAGDATTFPIKQGGLACQQADAVAAAIAAACGAALEPHPFRPVLRGLLLTGGAPLYLRAELDPSGAVIGRVSQRLAGEASIRALWWPPGKVAGRYLAPYLATARPRALGREPLIDRTGSPGGARGDADDAMRLALLLADADAAAGDYAQALHALDAAAALGGGVLPVKAARRRDVWRPRLGLRPAPVPISEPEEDT
jgi:sulfide:quinone oxidoreductase